MALVERDLRRFRRSPVLLIVSMVFPIIQLIVLGYAFGGKLRNLTVAVVDQDRGIPAVKLREMMGAIEANAGTFQVIPYSDLGLALQDLREGRLNGVLNIPPGFSRKQLGRTAPEVALIEDNADNFVASALEGTFRAIINDYNQTGPQPRLPPGATLSVVEV